MARLAPKAAKKKPAAVQTKALDPQVLERIGKKAAQYFRERLAWPKSEELALLAGVATSEADDYQDVLEDPERLADLYGKNHIDITRGAFLRAYSRLLRELTRTPSTQEVIEEMANERQVDEAGVEVKAIFGEQALFRNLDDLKERTRRK